MLQSHRFLLRLWAAEPKIAGRDMAQWEGRYRTPSRGDRLKITTGSVFQVCLLDFN